ncbi:MAG TPA: hypothetical protein VFG71_04515 [Nitrospiraceae bacterium]|nr:hypothetical protein [Nitrospiraceae bacterium]
MRLYGRLLCATISLWMSGFDLVVHPAAEIAAAGIPDEQRLEVLIRNYDFEIVHRSPVVLGGETVIILRNQDIVRHGFTSPALPQLYLRVEGEGIGSYGKGIEGLYIEPGKTLVIRLVVEHSGRLAFHCDLHPEMKGELLLLDVPAA